MFRRENAVIEGLEMTLEGSAFDTMCHGSNAGPLTAGKMSRNFKLKVN